MKKIGIIILGLLVGGLIFKYIIRDYDISVSSTREIVYFAQYGVYSSIDSMKENTKSIDKYIYQIEDNKYYVFLGFTQKNDNIIKLKGYFKNIGYDIYSKEMYISNSELLNIIPTYDSLLENVSDDESIKYILDEELLKYKEVINEN